MATSTPESETVVAEVRPGDYGTRVIAVEPGGAEFVALKERHGRPVNLLWTWLSPNLEFATVFLGVFATTLPFTNLTFAQAAWAILIGTGLGSFTHAVLSMRGPRHGVPQMVLSRISFGWFGNALPAGLNAVIAGIGWFAVNSVSGAFALNSLLGLPKWISLLVVVVVQIGIAFYGHNLVQAFERFAAPVLGIIFAAACVMIFAKAHYSVSGRGGDLGGFLIVVGATFGYAAGWNPYATDYTRYLPPGVSKARTGLFAGLGVFLSCTVLELAGAASTSLSVNADAPTSAFTQPLGAVLGNLTLLAIVVGAVAANAINIYSGALSFTAMGFHLPLKAARAITALAFGALGFILALFGLKDAGHSYENFLLVISYWIGPWLGVYFTDWVLRRGHRVDGFLFDRRHRPLAGWVAMLVGIVLSVWLFANQSIYTGLVPKAVPQVGDIAFFVGFLISALLYAVIHTVERRREPQEAVLVTPEEQTAATAAN